jgi:hypothetical protein
MSIVGGAYRNIILNSRIVRRVVIVQFLLGRAGGAPRGGLLSSATLSEGGDETTFFKKL